MLLRRANEKRLSGNGAGTNFEANAFALLQDGYDLEQVPGIWISSGTEHPHQTLGRASHGASKIEKTDGCVDQVAKNGLPGINIAGEETVDGFAQQRLAESCVAHCACLNGALELTGERHDGSEQMVTYM